MSQKRKICVVITNRANYGRVKSVMRAIQDHPKLELQVIACSSAVLPDYGHVSTLIEQDGFPIHEHLFTTVAGDTPMTMAKSAGLAIIELSTQFDHLKPDIVLVVADRYEVLAVATAASYMNIPLAHTQGGEFSGSIDDRVRHAVTKLADFHFPATELSCERLICMGEDPEMIWMVGCPSIDLIVGNTLSVNGLRLQEKYGGIGYPIDFKQPFLLMLQHPVTTEFEHGLAQIEETLYALQELEMPTLLMWPNVDAGSDDISKGIRRFYEQCDPRWLYLVRNVLPEDYNRLLNASSVIIGNSSSGIRESNFLGIPSVNIGSRQHGRERGENVLDVDYDRHEIVRAIRLQLEKGRYMRSTRFGSGDAGRRIAEVLANFDLVNLPRQKRLMC